MRHALHLSAFALAAAAALPAGAALPPQYQRLAELRAILSHPGVTEAFGATPIERVLYVREDLYLVTAGRCRLPVVIAGLPSDNPGPRRFEVRPGRRVCG